MPLRDLLVVLENSPASPLRLEAAVRLAKATSAHLTALCLVPEPFLPPMLGAHIPADLLTQQLAESERAADARLAAAIASAQQHGVQCGALRETDAADRLPAILARHARRADLTLIGQPDPEHDELDMPLLVEAAFMQSGRPALVLPSDGTLAVSPQRIVVAWDGSREAARAVNDALPFCEGADEVVVLVVDAKAHANGLGPEPGTGIAAHLARHGVRVAVTQASSGSLGIGGTIRAQVQEQRADLLVMGGYGHSRLREVILGGATKHMLEQMTTPVLISH